MKRNTPLISQGSEEAFNSKEKAEPGFSTYTHRTTAATESHAQNLSGKIIEIDLEKDSFSTFLMRIEDALGYKELE